MPTSDGDQAMATAAKLQRDREGVADDVDDGARALGIRRTEIALHRLAEEADVLLPERLVQPVGGAQPLLHIGRHRLFPGSQGPPGVECIRKKVRV